MSTHRILPALVLALVPSLGAGPAMAVPAPRAAAGAPELREEILVIVDNHIITRHQFQQAVEQEHAALYRQFSGKELDEKLKEGREKTLQGLIDSFLVEDKANDLGLGQRVNDDYLHAYVEDIKKQNNFATDADFEKALRGSLGIGMQEYLKRTKQQILQQEVLRSEVYGKIAIEDQELRAYYEAHKDKFLTTADTYSARHILVKVKANEQDKDGISDADAKVKIAKIQAELKAGKKLADLAKEYSDDPGSKNNGGLYENFDPNQMVPEFGNAVKTQAIGVVGEPVKTQFGYHIVEVTAKTPKGTLKPFESVSKDIPQMEKGERQEKVWNEYLDGIKKEVPYQYFGESQAGLKEAAPAKAAPKDAAGTAKPKTPAKKAAAPKKKA
jgi:parvulin-like peptidyl-prolyl isomerase